MASSFQGNDDEAMGGVDDNMATTPTGGYNHGYQEGPRRQSIQSENYPPANGSFSPSTESDPNARHPSSSSGYQQQAPQPYPRPSSGLSGSGDRYGGYPQNYQDQSQRTSSHQDASRVQGQGQGQASVVIKVGMVGDAQIGKTSLMVKYVEGSWDEDYIQTLGTTIMGVPRTSHTQGDKADHQRCQFYGKDHLNPQHRNHLLDLGSRRPARIRQHAPPSLQRCSGHTFHVRSNPEEHTQFHKGMVPPRSRFQQDCHSFLSRHEVRPFCQFPTRGAGRNIYTGEPSSPEVWSPTNFQRF